MISSRSSTSKPTVALPGMSGGKPCSSHMISSRSSTSKPTVALPGMSGGEALLPIGEFPGDSEESFLALCHGQEAKIQAFADLVGADDVPFRSSACLCGVDNSGKVADQ
eukprot:CAMPEP_0195040726 /NCGR_PEP_ID=MMETSP0326_2-20130528/80490_1 /TAXON_ID=2866 ORGANISM="Crypthecodinium cohnii, Strain Seligo" /NCGR_SAMPLE_ID=MMETSP0326_2 /ASSEMBLY_ACC=CAM_ASM_000348 /LENGTH=108 /DNA_ID=CAMNT_0040067669 /DNA_START=308 /DNA_END=633 /DNA_ORIENTATION=+